MKKIIIDTNIIFSLLLSKTTALREIFFKKELKFYTCKFVIVELFKYKEKIIKSSSLSEEDIFELLYMILKRINIYDEAMIGEDSLRRAFNLCKDIDEKDTLIVALSLELNAEIWTGDKKLMEGLKQKGFTKFLFIE